MGFGAFFALGMSAPAATAAISPGAVQASGTCYHGGGGSNVLFIESCGPTKEVTYDGPRKFGHVKIWERSDTGNWRNSSKDEWWSTQTGDRQSFTWTVPWNDATCAEFYWDQNGSYSQYGSIVCTPH
jgi:hypothetical protein